ncbi:MAG TPA: hypothetical protein VLH38_01200 [Patescibacteria group bacterium]|nr:hypothetical protein [Patescibacteria group bacterium]
MTGEFETTPSPVRTFYPYHEAQGLTLVNKEVAQMVLDVSLEKLSEHAGVLGAIALKGVRLPGEDVVDIGKIRIGEGAHTVLFTGRDIANPAEGRRDALGECMTWLRKGRIVRSLTAITFKDFHKGGMKRAIGVTLHELGHGFGLQHCEKAICTMVSGKKIDRFEQPNLAFCDDCAGALEVQAIWSMHTSLAYR